MSLWFQYSAIHNSAPGNAEAMGGRKITRFELQMFSIVSVNHCKSAEHSGKTSTIEVGDRFPGSQSFSVFIPTRNTIRGVSFEKFQVNQLYWNSAIVSGETIATSAASLGERISVVILLASFCRQFDHCFHACAVHVSGSPWHIRMLPFCPL